MSGEFIAFFILSLLTIGGAVFMISFTRVVHMVISLGITFISIAGHFVLLGAEFVGVSQILVYSGAISILMLFGIMLTKHDANDEGTGNTWKNRFVLVFVAALFGLLFWGIQNAPWQAPAPEAAEPMNNAKEIGIAVFTKYVIPFELLSVLLLVCLVGAIIMAKKEGDQQ